MRTTTAEARRLGGTAYELFDVIGQGGVGTVYRARDRRGRCVAVKLLERRATKTDERVRERFRFEGEVMASLDSPHIVRVLDRDETGDGLPFIVMELLVGEDLEARLRRVGRLDAERVVTLGLQLCAALETAHARGVVHGDVKPGNIFLRADRSERDHAVLLDFGTSPSPFAPSPFAPQDDASVVGTPEYMAPEQIDAELGPVDVAADVYALGVVLFRCLAGELPFVGEPLSQLFQRLHGSAPALSAVARDVPAELAAIVDRALRRDPTQRFASVAELAAALAATRPQARDARRHAA